MTSRMRMDADTAVRGVAPLAALKNALAQRGVMTRLDVLPVPFLAIRVLHLHGHGVMVHVVLGNAGPDVYTWGFGQHTHPASDPHGAADALAAHVQRIGYRL